MCFKTAACINHCAGRAFVPVCARVRAYVRACVCTCACVCSSVCVIASRVFVLRRSGLTKTVRSSMPSSRPLAVGLQSLRARLQLSG